LVIQNVEEICQCVVIPQVVGHKLLKNGWLSSKEILVTGVLWTISATGGRIVSSCFDSGQKGQAD